MTTYLHRKYIDLIRQTSSKYASLDPTVEYRLGSYGYVDKETGEFHVEGNVYDPEFKINLRKYKTKLDLANFPPEEVQLEENVVIATRTATLKDFPADKESQIPGIATASFKGHWEFDRRNKRDAILVLHKPRQFSFKPDVVLEALFKVDTLINKCLITSITTCPAYSMYLSEKSVDAGNTASLALVAKNPSSGTTDASGGLTWWSDTSGGILRHAYDEAGKYAFTPLFEVKRPIQRVRRFFRDKVRPEPEGDDLWCHDIPPWDPLDEDGEEDLLVSDFQSTDQFTMGETDPELGVF